MTAYDMEEEPGYLAADPIAHAVNVVTALAALGRRVNEIYDALDAFTLRLDRLQDAQLAPVLEGSAVAVELRLLRELLTERLPVVARDTTAVPGVPEGVDCAELWRLATEWLVATDGDGAWYAPPNLLRAYVRDHRS